MFMRRMHYLRVESRPGGQDAGDDWEQMIEFMASYNSYETQCKQPSESVYTSEKREIQPLMFVNGLYIPYC